MTGERRWWRAIGAIVSAVAVTSGLPTIPAGAAPPPPLSWPEVAPAIPEKAPAAEGALAVPDDWSAPVPKSVREAFVAPTRDTEIVGQRGPTTAAWRNTDGTRTIVLHSRPAHFQPPGAPVWEQVDVRVVADPERPGGVRTTAGAWTARFGPIQPGGLGGLELTTAAGPIHVVPDLAPAQAAIAPVVGAASREVVYADVWPGVDLRYRVDPAGLAQAIVIRMPGCESFRFLVEGLGLAATPEAERDARLEVTGAQAATLRLEPGEVTRTGADTPSERLARLALHVRDAEPTLVGDDPAIPGPPQDVELSVAGSWLDRALGADEGPVVVDSTSLIGPPGITAFRNVDREPRAKAQVHAGRVRAGHQPGDPAALWRSAIRFDYVPAIQGRQVLQARLRLSARADGNDRTAHLRLRSALPGGHDQVAGDGKDWAEVEVKPGTTDVTADVTDLVTDWQRAGWALGSIGVLAADEDPALDSYVRFDDAQLELVVNTPAPAPALAAPGQDAMAVTSTTPTLAWAPVSDPDGEPVEYVARLATGRDGDSGLVASSPASTGTSWQVPPGLLRDGGAYTWRVFASDGRAWTASEVRRLTVDRRAGTATTAPTDVVGPLTTNLVTGASTLAIDGPTLATVRDDVGLHLAHDSQAPTTGLVGTYRADANRNTAIDDSDPIRLVRTDPQLSFAWNRPGAAAPSAGVPTEWFTVRWAGFVALPAGKWQLGARHGDGVRIRVDGQQVLDRWVVGPPGPAATFQDGTVAGGAVHEIGVDYFQAAEDASLQLWARNADAPAQAFVVPAAWLSPSDPSLPPGWSLAVGSAGTEYTRAEVGESAVTLLRPDGSRRAFRATADGSGFAPPAGADDVVAVNPDGTVTARTPAGRTLAFEPGGQLARVASAVDDRAPAAAVPSYGGQGRLEKLTDPVSGRSIRLVHSPSDLCPEPPPLPGGEPLDPAPAGMVCRISYWDGTTTDLHYRHGLLAYARNPGDAYWAFGYDPAGRLTDVVDPLAFDATLAGAVDGTKVSHQIAYDPAGQVASISRPEATPGLRATRSYAYAPEAGPGGELLGGKATVTRSGLPGPFRTVGYDARGRLTRDADAGGQATNVVWDDDDRVVAGDRPDGMRTTTRYDQGGHPTDRWGPAPAALFNPDGSGGPGVPHEQLRYDEGLHGQQVQYWGNADVTGTPAAHSWQPGSLSALSWEGAPPVEGVGADGWSARFGGHLTFPSPGTYALQVNKDDRARVYLDDQLVIDAWDTPGGWSAEVPFTTAQPGESHRLRVDFADVSGPATLQLMWKPPGAAAREAIPDAQFSPGFGLLTTQVDVDGVTVGHEYADPEAAIGPQHHLEVRTIVDPAGLRLVEAVGHEPAGLGHFRPAAHVRPAGPQTQTTRTYYGDQEERDNPCTRPADPANQAGLVKLEQAPDPDGDGAGRPRVREVVHDAAGRVVAARLTGDADWTCTAYDGRGRVTSVRYPAVGDRGARTVTTDYAADPDGPGGPRPAGPLAVSVGDDVGTIVTESNLWGQTTATTDVFGNRTTTAYDAQGRAVLVQGPAGALATTYDGADRVSGVTRDGQALASDLVYDPAGHLTAATYGNGTTGTLAYDPSGSVVTARWSGAGGAPLTSDEVARRPGGGLRDQRIDGQDHHPGDDYTYDTAGRLLEAWVPGRHISYQFAVHDGCGPLTNAGADSNRTHYLLEGGPVTCFCYDRAGRLSAADSATGSIRYDAHDNVDGIFGEDRRYDAADRLTEIVDGATTVAYRRDAADRIVERRLNGAVTARYGTGFTTDGANAVVEALVELPGGVRLTTRAAGNVWSYPNAQGGLAAVADQAGAKVGATTVYDPSGIVVTGPVPDNASGHLDFAWEAHPLEHEPGLQPVVHQGTRQYSPILGRVL